MDVSVIIPARNERGFIGSGLLALEQQTYDGVWEAIVVDNASCDHTGDAVRRAFPWVCVIEERIPGVQRAREAGRLAATGNILAFLDADTVPSAQWIENGLRYFRDPSIAAVTGSYDFYDSGPLLLLGARFVSVCVYPVALWYTQNIRKSGIMIGGNCFIRACALEDIGGFNTAIDFWGDDTDTAIRLARVGKAVLPGRNRTDTLELCVSCGSDLGPFFSRTKTCRQVKSPAVTSGFFACSSRACPETPFRLSIF